MTQDRQPQGWQERPEPPERQECPEAGPVQGQGLPKPRLDRSLVPEALRAFFAKHPHVALAYSGGVDSACLLACALACGAQVFACRVDSVFPFPFETRDALLAARQLGVTVHEVEVDLLSFPQVASNPPDRCYQCKRLLYAAVADAAAREGFTTLIDGTNATDDPARRPGFRAIEERGVLSPLRLAGLGKEDVRALSARMGLLTADKPSYACRAVQVPFGTPLTLEALERVGARDWR